MSKHPPKNASLEHEQIQKQQTKGVDSDASRLLRVWRDQFAALSTHAQQYELHRLMVERLYWKIIYYMRRYPERLMSTHQTYSDRCIGHEELMQMMERYLIVKLNMLNMLCRKIQVLERQPWRQRTLDLKARVVMFFREHVQHQAGKKVFYIKMTQLATEVNDSRLNVSIVLNELERDERIILKRGIIEIPALQILNN
jgi:hypothetical protein